MCSKVFDAFEETVFVDIPTFTERLQMLQMFLDRMEIGPKLSTGETRKLNVKCHGLVAGDLLSVCKRASFIAMDRFLFRDGNAESNDPDQPDGPSIDDFFQVVDENDKSLTRKTCLQIPNVQWDDVGGLTDVKVCSFKYTILSRNLNNHLLRISWKKW